MRLRGTAALAAATACAVILGAAPVRADETGGSMGGGDFSSTSPSYSYSSSSYSDDSPSYSYSGGGSSGSTGDPGADLVIALIAIAFSLVVAMMKQSKRGLTSYEPDYAVPDTTMAYGNIADVTVLRVAIDARARKFVQAELARIAGVADTRTAEGRATMLREVALMLRRLRDSWVYGGAVNFPMTSLAEAQQTYQRQCDDARGRFKTELVRNQQGAITRADAPELHSTSDDGPGVMLVTIVVAARHELFTVSRIGDGEDLRRAFESLSTMIAGELVAVEVVWMPAAADERISSIALEVAYPKPDLIPIAGALVGKVFCEYCGAPYPAEAIACPHCGGRAKGLAA